MSAALLLALLALPPVPKGPPSEVPMFGPDPAYPISAELSIRGGVRFGAVPFSLHRAGLDASAGVILWDFVSAYVGGGSLMGQNTRPESFAPNVIRFDFGLRIVALRFDDFTLRGGFHGFSSSTTATGCLRDPFTLQIFCRNNGDTVSSGFGFSVGGQYLLSPYASLFGEVVLEHESISEIFQTPGERTALWSPWLRFGIAFQLSKARFADQRPPAD